MRIGLLLAGLLSCAGCGGAGLSGSVDQFFPVDFTREEILRTDDAFQVSFYRDTPSQIDVVARLTVVTTGFDFKSGQTFDLSGEYAPGHPRAVVTHAAGGEPSRALPPVKRGTLTLSEGGSPGVRTRGTFDLAFADEGGDFGNGRTLSGHFDAKAQDANVRPDGGS